MAWIATDDCKGRFGCGSDLGSLRIDPEIVTKTDVPGSSAGTTSHTVTGLENETEYAFTVHAVDGNGRESEDIKNPPTATPTAGVPGQPTGLVAVADDRAVRLAWDDPGNADITGWQVSTRPAGSAWPANGGWTAVPDSGADTTGHTVTGLDNGRRYDFRIRAATSAGAGLVSGIASASPRRTGAGVRFSHVRVEVPEDDEAAYTVTLTSEPTANVTVVIAADDGGDSDLGVSPDALTFTTANWEAPQTVTLSAAEDDDAVDGTAVFVHRLTSDDDDYAGMVLRLRAREDDDDTAGVTVTAASDPLTVAEGGDPASWTVALESEPTAPVTIRVVADDGSDGDLGVSPAALTFTAADWETAQTVTVSAAEDDDAIDGNASFLHRATSAEEGYQGIEIASVAVDEVDDDSAGVTVTAASDPLPVTEGESTSWTVVLVTEPAAPVTISVARDAGGDAGLSAAPATLTFTTADWDTAQTVTVSAAEDDDAIDGAATFVHAAASDDADYAGFAIASVAVALTDNDTAGVTVGPVLLRVSEGSEGMWWVVLDTEPAASVRVTATVTGDDDLAIKGSSILVFTTANWNILQTVTVGASMDADDFNGTATVAHSATSDDDGYDGIEIESVEVTEDDDDLPPAPMELAGEPDDEAVVLGWTAPEVNGITGWEVRHRESDGGTWSTAQTLAPTPTEHRVEGLDNGTSYDFEVVAVNANGKSAAAGTTVVPALPNAAPVFAGSAELRVEETNTAVATLAATDADEVDAIAWAITGGADQALFSLDAKTGALAFKLAPDYEAPEDAASEDPENRAQNNEYIVEVEAASGAGPRRRTASRILTVIVTDKDGEVPGVPSDFRVAAATATTVTLAWTAPVENPGPVLSGYDIEVRTQGGGGWGAWTDADHDGTPQGAKVGGLADGASHEFRIRARNEEGASPWSAALAHAAKALTLAFLPDDASPLEVPEGGSASYAARLDDPPTGDVTVALSVDGDADLSVAPASLTFLAADWNRLQTITVSGADDADGVPGAAAVVHEATGGGYDGVTVERAVVEGEDDAEIILSISGPEVTVPVSGQEVTVPEGESVAFTAVLAAAPDGPVTVTATVAAVPAPDGDLTVTPAALTFTTANWRIPQTLTVAAAEDDDGIVGTAVLDLEPDAGFPAEAPRLVLTEGENDAVLTLSATEVTVPEGGIFEWTVVLGALPADTVTVAVTHSEGDSNLKVAKASASLTFTTDDWATPQTVRVRATHDRDDKDGTATILHAATGPAGYDGATAEVEATESDDDGVTVSVETIAVPEGGNASYTVVLDSKPTAAVTITATPAADGDGDLTVTAGDTLTFTTTSWNTPQTVTVAAAADTDNTIGTATIEHVATGGYQNMTIADVVATEIDSDRGTVTVSESSLTVPEGGSATYTLELDRAPSAAVTISITAEDLALASPDRDLTVSPNALVFTTADWGTERIVTVRAAEDNDNKPGSRRILHTVASDDGGYAGITVADVTATEKDNDGVTVSAETVAVPEGGTATWTVSLVAAPNADVTVAIAPESGGDTDLTVTGGATLTFTTSNWKTEQTVTVTAAADADRVAGSATFAHSATSADANYQGFKGPGLVATEVEADAGLAVPVAAVTVPEGGQAQWTVALNTEPTVPVTVAVTPDSGADADLTASPASLTFATDDWSDAQTVTVSSAYDPDNKDGSAVFVLAATSADTGYQGLDARVTATEKDGAPPTPTGFAGVAGDATVTLTWDDPEDPAVTAYRIRQRSGPSAAQVSTWDPWVTLEPDLGGASTGHVVTGLENGTAYVFRLMARNAAGWSAFAVTTKKLPEAGPPPQPTGFEASPGDAQVALGWTDPGDPDITGWQVRWRLAGEAWPSDADGDVWKDIDGSGADTVAHSVTGLGNGRAYDFQIRALAGPTLIGPASEVVRATPIDVGAGVTVKAAEDPLEVPENGQATWTLVLDALPSAPVTVAVAKADGGDPDLSLVTTALTFTTADWNTPQTVTVAAAEDDDVTAGQASFGHSALGGGYAGVAIADLAAVEADNDEAGVTLTPLAIDVPEGGSATYTLVLDALPAAAVTITLGRADGGDRDLSAAPAALTFTTDDWSTAQTVTVTAAEDDADIANGETVFAHSPSSTDPDFNFDTIIGGLTIGKVTATEVDNDVPGVTLSTTALTVPEAGTARYTLTLRTRPSGDVTVTVAKDDGGDADLRAAPVALTFTTAAWSVPQAVEVEADADGDTEAGSAVFSHSVTGGGYDDVEIEDVTATEADNDSGVVVSAIAVEVEEGAAGTWTLVLDAEPTAPVTVEIARAEGDADLTLAAAALTFATDAWNVAQTVTVEAAADDDANDGEAVFAHRVRSADSQFDGAAVADVLVTEADSDTPGITVSLAEVTVFEGGTGAWTVVLDTRPGAPVTVGVGRKRGSAGNITTSPSSLVFTTDDWATPWTVTVTAAESVDKVDSEAVFTHRARGADRGYAGLAGPEVTVSEIDNDRAGVVLSETGVTVPEGGEATWTAVLNRPPSADVTLEVSWKSGDTDITVATPRLTFTTADWDTPQTIRIRAADDADRDNGSAVIGHATRGGGYTGVAIADVTATEEDEDVGLVLSRGTLRIAEGDSGTYTVALAAEPGASVTVSVTKEAGGDDDLTVQPSELVFTTSNWNTGQTVTVDADADTDVVEGMARILHRAGDDISASVAVFEIDEDAAVDLAVEAEPLEVPEGGSAEYTIRLEGQPSGAVTIGLRARGDPDLSVSPAALTFTTGSWGAAQTVTVSAAEDGDVVVGQALVSHVIAGGDYDRVAIPGVPAIEVENDMLGVTLSESAIGVPEGGSAAYTVVLDAQPSGAVTIDLTASGDGDLRASPAALTFTTGSWSAAQTVTVVADPDADAAHGEATIAHAIAGGGYDGVAVPAVTLTEEDDDGTLLLSATRVVVPEDGEEAWTVRLAGRPAVPVTVSLSTAGDADLTVSPETLTFTTASWNTPQTVTAAAADDPDATNGETSVTLQAAGGAFSGVSAGVTVVEEDDDAELAFSSTAVTVPEGGSGNWTVALGAAPGGPVTVAIRVVGSDSARFAVSPDALTFTTANWQRPQSVTVASAEDGDVRDNMAEIRHQANGGGYVVVTGSVTVTQTDNDSNIVLEYRSSGGAWGLVPSPLEVPEGTAGQDPSVDGQRIQVSLADPPTDTRSVRVDIRRVAGGDADLRSTDLKNPLSHVTLEDFRGWDTQIRIHAREDADVLRGEATFVFSIAGREAENRLTAVEVDDDAKIIVAPKTLAITEGESGTYTVALDAAPAEAVEVAVSWNEDKAVTANPAVLTFTTSDWAAAQTVTVSATPDADADGFKATIRHEATGSDHEFAPEANVKVTVTDSDMVGVTIKPPELVASPPQTLVVEEGGSNAYTLQLATEPGGPVTIAVAPKAGSDARLGASPSSLVFTSGNWSVPQTVTVTAAPDPQVVEATATIVHTLADPGAYGSLVIPEVTVREDDTDAKLVVTGPRDHRRRGLRRLHGGPQRGTRPVGHGRGACRARRRCDGDADRADLHDRQLVDGADRERRDRVGRRHARRRAGGPLRGLRRCLRRRPPRGIRG